MNIVDVGSLGRTIDDGKDYDNQQEIMDTLDLLAGKALSLLEKVAGNYVNLKQFEALMGLQTCCHEIFRRADQCCRESKNYEISETENSDLH